MDRGFETRFHHSSTVVHRSVQLSVSSYMQGWIFKLATDDDNTNENRLRDSHPRDPTNHLIPFNQFTPMFLPFIDDIDREDHSGFMPGGEVVKVEELRGVGMIGQFSMAWCGMEGEGRGRGSRFRGRGRGERRFRCWWISFCGRWASIRKEGAWTFGVKEVGGSSDIFVMAGGWI